MANKKLKQIQVKDTVYDIDVASSLKVTNLTASGVPENNVVTAGAVLDYAAEKEHSLYPVTNLTVVDAGSSTKSAYLAAKWSVADVAGITTPVDGMSLAIRTPGAGTSGGILLSIDNGVTYYPIVRNTNTLVTTTYTASSTVIVTFNATQVASPYTAAGVTTEITGCWQTADYDANTKTTTGTSNKASTKLYIAGATSQSSSGATTYSNANVYIGTDNCLYSNGKKVLTDYTDTDTKNTTGATDTSAKIFLVGATAQTANPQTYSHNTAYVGTDGCLYSNNTKVSVEGHGPHVEYSSTAPVMDGTASAGTASTVARSDHKHPVDTSRAAKSVVDGHIADPDVHFTTTERGKLSGIESGAQVNTITGVKGSTETSYRTGDVNITKANIGLGNVDNTADANKSVKYATSAGSATNDANGKSIAGTYATKAELTTHNTATDAHSDIRTSIANLSSQVQDLLDVDDSTLEQMEELLQNLQSSETLIANKLDKTAIVNNLTTNDATKVLSAAQGKALKDSLDSHTSSHAPSNAQANQNAFSNVKVGSTTIAADTTTDTIELAGSNVTITPDATNDKVTIGITKANVTTALGYTPPTTNTTYSIATASAAGLVKPISVITKPTINSASTTSGKYYPVQMSSDGNMFVNVPWSAANPDYVSKSATSVQCLAGGLVVGKSSTTGISGTGTGRIMFTGQSNPLIGLQSTDDSGNGKTPYYVQTVASDDKLYIGPTSTKALTFDSDGNMASPASLSIAGTISEGGTSLSSKYTTKAEFNAAVEPATPNLAYTLSDDGTYYICSGIAHGGVAGHLVIAREYNGKPVKAIANNAFKSSTSFNCSEVSIPDTITSIGAYAFYTLPSLERVIIPDSVTTIGNSAFYGCTNLKSVKLSQNCTTLPCNLFAYCSSLKHIELPSTLGCIYSECFYGSGLEEIFIPASVWEVNDDAFSYSQVKRIIYPHQPEDEGSAMGLIQYCDNLTHIEYPAETTYAFSLPEHCPALKSVVLPKFDKQYHDHWERVYRDSKSFTDIYFRGSEADWESISWGAPSSGEDYWFENLDPTIHYNYTDDILTLHTKIESLSATSGYTHPTYTARTGYPTANATPAFGGTFSVSQITSDGKGHVTGATTRTVTIPNAAATTSAAGLMSAADKTKLNGIATGANKYVLPAASASALGGIKVSFDSSSGTLTISTT